MAIINFFDNTYFKYPLTMLNFLLQLLLRLKSLALKNKNIKCGVFNLLELRSGEKGKVCKILPERGHRYAHRNRHCRHC